MSCRQYNIQANIVTFTVIMNRILKKRVARVCCPIISYYIGTFIRNRRKKIGLSGQELAQRICISQQQVSRYERGEVAISVKKLFYILSVLNVSEEEMLILLHSLYQKVVSQSDLSINGCMTKSPVDSKNRTQSYYPR